VDGSGVGSSSGDPDGVAAARPGPRRRRSRGVAMVEFAIVLPLLALIVFGTLDLGRAYSLKNRLKNAAREGALYAQTHPLNLESALVGDCADPDSAEYHALAELDAAGDALSGPYTVTFDPFFSDGDLVPPCGTADDDLQAGDVVQVRVTAEFGVITPFIGNLVGDSITITETVDVVLQG